MIIGRLASLVIPGFQKMRVASQGKAVRNNARQLAAAAEQYYPHRGVADVDAVDLVGPTRCAKILNLVAQETYPTTLSAGIPITITIEGLAAARTLTSRP